MATNPVIAERRNVSHGANGVYDISLHRSDGDALMIEVSHAIYFDFSSNEANAEIDWTDNERAAFTEQFQTQIPNVWDQADHVVIKNRPVSVRFVSEIRTSSAGSQWNIRVFKLKSTSSSRQSSVSRGGVSDADFDSNDGRRKNLGDETTQTGIIHEFGHMIGLADEYKSSSPNLEDRPSVMNWGSTVRERHLAHFVAWARPHVDQLSAEQLMSSSEERLPPFLHGEQRLTTVGEAAAVRYWKENLAPAEAVLWEVRRRDDHAPIPVDEVEPVDFANLEIVFEQIPGSAGSVVWHPNSAEAVEALFEGS